MKRFLLVLVSIICVIYSMCALAEEWHCSECDIQVEGNFCSNCGAEKQSQDSDEPQNGEHFLELSIDFVENLFLSTYDVEIHIDGEKIATMDHGEDYYENIPLDEGKHSIYLRKKGDENICGFVMVQVSGETYFSCTIHAHDDHIAISEISTNGKVDAEEQMAVLKEEYAATCETVKYSDVERYPDKYEGMRIKVSGKVIQVSEGWFDSVTLRIKDGNGDTWYAEYSRKEGESRILENDRVTAYGTCSGVETYTTIMGESVTIPAIKIEYVNIK